jgi:hypothetical protein
MLRLPTAARSTRPGRRHRVGIASLRALGPWLRDHRTTAVLTVAGLALSCLGAVQLLSLLRDRPLPHPTASAGLDGLSAAVTEAGWLSMDMPQTDGYQMPAAMNPGMPAAGDERLALTITVVNTTGTTGSLRTTKEFSVRTAKDGKRWTPVSGTFGDLPRLAPGNGVTGILYYDLPASDVSSAAPVWVDWSRSSGTRALSIPLPGLAPTHSHPS